MAAIATFPEHAAWRFAKVYRLEAAEPPVSLSSYETSLVWLAKYDQDPARRWLRSVMMEHDPCAEVGLAAGGRKMTTAA